jgi:hypothetical protein
VLPLILISSAAIFIGCANLATSQVLNNSPINSAAKVKVVAQELNWDNDPGTDGLRIWVDLLDNRDIPLKYANGNLPIKITIRPSPMEDLCESDTILYVDNATLKDWYNDSFASGAAGVKDILWGYIDQDLLGQLQKFGLLDVSVTLPDGKQIIGSLNDVAIKP